MCAFNPPVIPSYCTVQAGREADWNIFLDSKTCGLLGVRSCTLPDHLVCEPTCDSADKKMEIDEFKRGSESVFAYVLQVMTSFLITDECERFHVLAFIHFRCCCDCSERVRVAAEKLYAWAVRSVNWCCFEHSHVCISLKFIGHYRSSLTIDLTYVSTRDTLIPKVE